MDYQQIRDVLTEHFKNLLERRMEKFKINGRLTANDRAALENSQDFAVQALVDGDYTFIASDAEIARFSDQYALPVHPNSPSHQMLRSEFLKAFRDYCALVLQRDAGLENYDFTATKIPSAEKSRKLADALEEYYTEKLRLKDWRDAVAKGFRSQFEILLQIIGQDASLHIEPETARNAKAVLLRLPKNMTKKAAYRDKGITELAAMDIPVADRFSPVNVAKYISTYSAFYEWAVKNKLTPENPFSLLIDDATKAAIIREAFNEEDAQRILAKVMQSKKPHQKWGVLLAFYTGARLNEIAQLRTDDIKQVGSVWCIDINDDGEDKQVKNESSKRVVPIHSRLIELGILDFVDSVGKGRRLFQELSYYPETGYGRNLGRWFNNSLLDKQLGIKSPSLVFHSIRHTAAQQLRNNRVPEATIKDILGHSQHGVTLNVYAKNLDVSVIQEAIETLRYA